MLCYIISTFAKNFEWCKSVKLLITKLKGVGSTSWKVKSSRSIQVSFLTFDGFSQVVLFIDIVSYRIS